jgi:undecaprenyl-diphosphatase
MGDLDVRTLAMVYGGANGRWGPAMIALTWLGSGWGALALLPLIAWSRTRRFATALALAVAVQAICVWALKLEVGRVRPWIALGLAAPLGAPHDGSFPSGHASGSFCVAAFVTVALPAVWRSPAWRVRSVAAATMALASLIAVSRVYLGAHFPSDVIAGALTGACLGGVAGLQFVSRRTRERRPPAELPRSAAGRQSGTRAKKTLNVRPPCGTFLSMPARSQAPSRSPSPSPHLPAVAIRTRAAPITPPAPKPRPPPR